MSRLPRPKAVNTRARARKKSVHGKGSPRSERKDGDEKTALTQGQDKLAKDRIFASGLDAAGPLSSWTLLLEDLRHLEKVLDLPVGLITVMLERHAGPIDPYHIETSRLGPHYVKLTATDVNNLFRCQP